MRRRLLLPSEVMVDAPECGRLPPLWRIELDPKVLARYHHYIQRRGNKGTQNAKGIRAAEMTFCERALVDDIDALPLPPEVPPLRLGLPERGFNPDFFRSWVASFASRRLREALALPPDVVEFTPVEIVDPGEAIRAQDYLRMRVLAEAEGALDPGRSGCEITQETGHITGRTIRRAWSLDSIVLCEGFQPRTPLFRLAENPTVVLATDALALRVLEAGCTGIEFQDFSVAKRFGRHITRRRTLTGVALLRVGFAD